jgi:hypothetical protein
MSDLDYPVRNLRLEYEWLQFVSLTNEVLKDKRTNNDMKNITHKTKDRVTRTPLKTEGELKCPERVGCSYSTNIVIKR